jgi:dUTP pyrophosphatase
MNKLKIKKLNKQAIVPKYATKGAACFDLHCLDDVLLTVDKPTHIFSTGLAFDIPEGKVMLAFSRSSQGFKYDVRLANCTGVIDSDYTGEVKVKLTLDGANSVLVNKFDRVCQCMLVDVEQFEFEEVDELKLTERGDNGIGSTGK